MFTLTIIYTLTYDLTYDLLPLRRWRWHRALAAHMHLTVTYLSFLVRWRWRSSC